MAFVHFYTKRFEMLGDERVVPVGARHGVAEIAQHLGDAAHARTADADEMHAARTGADPVGCGRLLRGTCAHAATSTQSCAMSTAACGLASARAACAIAARRARSPMSSPSSCAMCSALASD